MYRRGFGVPKDAAQAFKWWKEAASKGVPIAQASLGATYWYGDGVAQNKVSAYMWFEIAQRNKPEEFFIERRDEIARQLSPDEISAAKEMALRCIESGYKDCGW